VKLATLAEDPAAFDSRRTWFRAFAVGENEHAVPTSPILRIVGELGGCIEVCAADADAFDVWVGAAFPFDHVFLVDGVVEG